MKKNQKRPYRLKTSNPTKKVDYKAKALPLVGNMHVPFEVALTAAPLGGKVLTLLCVLKDYVHHRLGYSWLSNETLAVTIGVSMRTIGNYLDKLDSVGLINRTCIYTKHRVIRQIRMGRGTGKVEMVDFAKNPKRLLKLDKYGAYTMLENVFGEMPLNPAAYGTDGFCKQLGAYIKDDKRTPQERKDIVQRLGILTGLKLRLKVEPDLCPYSGSRRGSIFSIIGTLKNQDLFVFLEKDNDHLKINELFQAAGFETITTSEEAAIYPQLIANSPSLWQKTAINDPSNTGSDESFTSTSFNPSEEGKGILPNPTDADASFSEYPLKRLPEEISGLQVLSTNPIGNIEYSDISDRESKIQPTIPVGEIERGEPVLSTDQIGNIDNLHKSSEEELDYLFGPIIPVKKIEGSEPVLSTNPIGNGENPQKPADKQTFPFWADFVKKAKADRKVAKPPRKKFLERGYTTKRLPLTEEEKLIQYAPSKKHKVNRLLEGGARRESERRPLLTTVIAPDGTIKAKYSHTLLPGKKVPPVLPTVKNRELELLPSMPIKQAQELLVRLGRTRLTDLLYDPVAVELGKLFTNFEWTQKKALQWRKVKSKYKVTMALVKVLMEHKSSYWRPEYEKCSLDYFFKSVRQECGDHIEHWLICAGDEETWKAFNEQIPVEVAKVNARIEKMS